MKHISYIKEIIKTKFQYQGVIVDEFFDLQKNSFLMLTFKDGTSFAVSVNPVKQIEVKNEPKPKTTPRWKE